MSVVSNHFPEILDELNADPDRPDDGQATAPQTNPAEAARPAARQARPQAPQAAGQAGPHGPPDQSRHGGKPVQHHHHR